MYTGNTMKVNIFDRNLSGLGNDSKKEKKTQTKSLETKSSQRFGVDLTPSSGVTKNGMGQREL